jgi:hypothetical protein
MPPLSAAEKRDFATLERLVGRALAEARATLEPAPDPAGSKGTIQLVKEALRPRPGVGQELGAALRRLRDR